MKLKLLLLCALFSGLVSEAKDDAIAASDRNMLESKQPITPSFYNGVIHLSDLDTSASAGGAMFTISAPGRYYIASDLSLAPTNSRAAALKITANNVFLNLNSATIFQRASNTQTGLMGVEIAASVNNVRVINGTINGLNVSDTTEQNAGVYIGSSANSITIEDMVVSNCTSATAEVTGFLVSSSATNIKFINCHANNNTNTKATATDDTGTVNGFKLTSASGCLLQDCSAVRNASTDHNVFGFRLELSNHNRLIGCKALNQVTSSNDANDIAAGFYSSDGLGNLFDSCTAMGTSASTVSVYAIGFRLGDTTVSNESLTTIKRCYIQGNGGGTTAGGIAIGIHVTSGVSLCNIIENTVLSNGGASADRKSVV